MAAVLADWLADRGNGDAIAGEAVAGKVAFVFSGNGSQWSEMGRDALRQNAIFRATIAHVDSVLAPILGWSVAEQLVAEEGWPVEDTTVSQPLLFAVQVATVEALRAAGIDGDMFLGHSVGEVAAAWAAGALRLTEACWVIAARSRLQALTAGDGRMGVLSLSPERAAVALEGTRLEIAAVNASAIVTVAGLEEDIAALAERAAAEGWAFTTLGLRHAFHSAAMDVIQAPLLEELASLAPPLCPSLFISTVTGDALPADARLNAAYWWRNVREPVRFAAAAATAMARGARILVEIGPQPILQAYLTDALRAADATGRAVTTLTIRRSQERDPIAMAAARCHVAGCDMRGAALFSGPRQHRDLPSYPWQRERHWISRTTELTDLATLPAEHPLLGTRVDGAEALQWTNHLGPSLQPWLADHVVGGATVAPAALLTEMALAAARLRHPAAAALQVVDFEISRPLTFEPGTLREVRLRVSADTADFQITSRPRLSEDPWTVHAAGRLAADEGGGVSLPTPVLSGERMDPATLYALAGKMGLAYGPAFQVVTGVAAESTTRADVTLALPPGTAPPDGLLLPPTLLDGAFQGLVGLAARLLPAGDGVVPWRFGRVRLLQPAGAVPVAARLVVAKVGPRSVRADIHLVDAAGDAVAELRDCWFVRVPLGAGSGAEGWIYHLADTASTDPNTACAAGKVLPHLLVKGDARASAPDDSGLLADAFAALVVEEAFRSLLPAPDAPFTIANLVATGAVAPGQRERCAELLGWLEVDGLATVTDGQWCLAPPALPSADEVLRTLVFDAPSAVADAALLSEAAERLQGGLRGGHDLPVPATALVDHMLHASPAGQAMMAALTGQILELSRAWPNGRPLRLLQLGARRGSFSRYLLRNLAQVGRPVQLHALTETDDQPALADALLGFPDATALRPEDSFSGRYDAVIGFCAQALDATELAAFLPLAPGGLVLLVEPGAEPYLVAAVARGCAAPPRWRGLDGHPVRCRRARFHMDGGRGRLEWRAAGRTRHCSRGVSGQTGASRIDRFDRRSARRARQRRGAGPGRPWLAGAVCTSRDCRRVRALAGQAPALLRPGSCWSPRSTRR